MSEFFASLAEPVGALWAVLLLGSGYLLWKRRFRCAVLVLLPVVFLFIGGGTPLPRALARSAEASALKDAAARTEGNSRFDVVLVLGGGFYESANDVYGFAFEAAGSRVVRGLELIRGGKATHLVLGGTVLRGQPGASAGAGVQAWVESFHLPGTTVSNLGYCENTRAEALAFKALKEKHGWNSVLLVTSALHMPRAVAVYREQGIKVSPMPCDFRALGTPGLGFSVVPMARSLNLMAAYLHEKIGWAVYRLKGWV